MLTRLARTSIPRSLARSLHTTAPRTMPLYVCYCPDYPDNLQTRLKAREAHLAAATEDKKTGASGEYLCSDDGLLRVLEGRCVSRSPLFPVVLWRAPPARYTPLPVGVRGPGQSGRPAAATPETS